MGARRILAKLLGETRAEKIGNMEEDSQQGLDRELERAANLMTFFVLVLITVIAVISVYSDSNQYI